MDKKLSKLNERDFPISNKSLIADEKRNMTTSISNVNQILANKKEKTNNLKEIKIPAPITDNVPITGIKKLVRGVEDGNNFLFYNSLSLIMLSMLAAGLVGVVFILYFTFKKDYQNNTEEL